MPQNPVRLKAALRGAVQGVGFRPFVYRLATELKLTGWVLNGPHGVFLEAEGPRQALDGFLDRLERDKPPHASIQSLEFSFVDPKGYSRFEIVESDTGGEPTALILPDIATCPECLKEILDPSDRRHLYPFLNCTNCGPRYSILLELPYDRAHTTMRGFALCADCRREFEDPGNRRFHAQPTACPACGPHLSLWDREGRTMAERHEALLMAAQAVREGLLVAVKGLGGFHLLCDAGNEEAVRRLRERKAREEKPLALMAASLEQARGLCETSSMEERLLASSEAPIVLLRKRPGAPVAPSVAPGNPHLGILLPSTPLHHLLMRELKVPVVATSGNISEEPLAFEGREALERLSGVADLFLTHDRPIARRVDDSVARVMMGREQVLRRARGYAPLPVTLALAMPPVLAVGAHLKNTVAIARGRNAFLSQHIGDLETAAAQDAFEAAVRDLGALYRFKPRAVAHDLHPDYASTRFAAGMDLPRVGVPHHLAHALACAAENEVEPPFLALSWDGTGLGPDGTLWGGEFLRVTADGWKRAGHFRTFRLPGGDQAVREPRRSALGLLAEMKGSRPSPSEDLAPWKDLSPDERNVLSRMLEQDVNSPRASSAGRLFDAVASLVGLRQKNRFEGQAAMELEFAAHSGALHCGEYPFDLQNADGAFLFDWQSLIMGVLEDLGVQRSIHDIARAFHATLASLAVAAAKAVGEHKVVLTGGCFQNRLLTEMAATALEREGFRAYWHQRVPPNDGGIALGQLVEASRQGVK